MKTRGKYIEANGSAGPVYRPTKLAAGIQTTATRSGHKLGDGDILTLAVRGTLDPLTHNSFYRKIDRTKTCECCGQSVPRMVLSARGRLRLARLRRKRGAE